MNKEKIVKRKKGTGNILITLVYIITGAAIGILTAKLSEEKGSDIWFIVGMLLFLGAGLLGIVIHEAGHLIFGLFTGYQFQSFRVANLMLLKEKDGYSFKKFSLAGTAGQCIMSPPELKDGKIPYVWYNLGGTIFNLLTAILFTVIYGAVKGSVGGYFCLMVIIVSLAMGLTNGIPAKSKQISNDGYNALSLGKNPEALRAFWLQLKLNAEMANGVRLSDMPNEWFRLPTEEEMKNTMIATEGVFYCNYLLEQHRFEETEQTINKLLGSENAIIGIHKGLLNCDRVCCRILAGAQKEQIEALMERDSEQKKFMDSMATFPSVIRTWYVYDLCVLKDEEKAKKDMEKFEKVAKTFPYPVSLEIEYEIFQLCQKLVKNAE